jgi:ABC-type transporter Mla maintaining outer membrane lipid asymmetry permease subunit MlaE
MTLLPMVAVVNLLVGALVAFLGTLQLRALDAENDIANLVGVAEIRELAPLMTAIVVSGRIGGGYDAGRGIGRKAARRATDVGHAATTAAVSGIIGAVALNAVFDVCTNALDI